MFLIVLLVVERPKPFARKVVENNGQYIITIPKGRVEDADIEEGDWLDFQTITTGKYAGDLRLTKVEEAEE